MRVYGPSDQPFLTEDSILAFALYLAGVQFCDDGLPCVNHYTVQMLREFGYRGLLPAEAALKAVEDKHRGVINYMFRAPDTELLAAYEDQKVFLEKSEGTLKQAVKDLMTVYVQGARTFEETIVRLVCTLVHMRVEFVNMWRKAEPLIRIDDGAVESEEVLADGSRVVTHGGFKFVGARARQKTREHLGL